MGRLTSAVNVIVSTKKPVMPLLVGTWGDRERTKSSNPAAAVKPAPSDEFVRALQTVREDRTALPESHLNVGICGNRFLGTTSTGLLCRDCILRLYGRAIGCVVYLFRAI